MTVSSHVQKAFLCVDRNLSFFRKPLSHTRMCGGISFSATGDQLFYVVEVHCCEGGTVFLDFVEGRKFCLISFSYTRKERILLFFQE